MNIKEIKLEVGKQYLLNTGKRAICVFKSDDNVFPFLLVVKDSHTTFWCNEAGMDGHYIRVTKEFVPRKMVLVFLNVYADKNGELFSAEAYTSLDEANAQALVSRVGVVSVELINNIETGEMEG